MYTEETAIAEVLRIQEIGHYRAIDAIKRDRELVSFIKVKFEKNYPNETESLSAKVWLLLHNGFKLICPYGLKQKFKKSRKGSQFNCKVSCQCTIDNRNKTMLNKYGVLGIQGLSTIQEQTKQTCLMRYGSISANGNKDIMKKQINTRQQNCISDYGVIHEKQVHFTELARETLNNKEKFSEMLLNLGTRKMADKLNVSKSTIVVYHRKLGLNIISRVRSCYEVELANWLKENNIEFKQNDMKQIKPKELDFYLPEYKVAIEIQGNYWHGNPKLYKPTDMVRSNRGKIAVSEIWKKDKYKYQMCLNNDIKLLSFWEDDWLENSFKIKSMILENLKKV